MRAIQLAVARPFRAPGLDQFPVPRDMQDTGVGAPVPLGYEDVAVRRDKHVVRLVEESRRGGAAGGPECHEQLARSVELEYLVALRGAGRRACERVGDRTRRTRRIVL